MLDGELIWAGAPDTPRAPASLTKLLTALVLLEQGWNPAAVVRVSVAAASVEGTRAGLRAGESLTADDALTALLVRSANDACRALVEQAAPSMAEFAARMNTRAHALGMARSHFGDPCGLDAPGQVSTVRDLLRLGAAALAEPRIAMRARQASARITTLAGTSIEGPGRARTAGGAGGRLLELRSSNALLGRVAGSIGLKSGFTSKAGRCVIAVAVRGGHHVWVVMLDAPNRWWVTEGLIEEAFSRVLPKPT